MNTAKRVALYGLFLALGLGLGYLEFLLGPITGIPGVKLGLANTVTVFCLYRLGPWRALGLGLGRVALSGLLFGGVMSMAFGAAGTLFSVGVMALLKRCGKFSAPAVSAAGGAAHNLGQILVAAVIVKTPGLMLYYYPALLLSGVLAGVLIGLLAGLLVRRVPGFQERGTK